MEIINLYQILKGGLKKLRINPSLLTEFEVANLIKKSVKTLQNDRWRRKGLPFVKLGKSVRYPMNAVVDYITVNTIKVSDN